MKKNIAGQVVGAQLNSRTDGSPVTTGSTLVFVTGDNGAQGGSSPNTATHKGNGYWEYSPDQGDTNYDHVAFTFVNSSAVNVTVQAWPSFPQTGDGFARLGTPASASLAADVANNTTVLALVKAVTDALGDMVEAASSPKNFRFTTHALEQVWDSLRAAHSAAGSFGEGLASVQGNVTGSVGSVSGSVGSVAGLTASNLDVAVSTRLASGSYTAPDNATIATISALLALVKAVTDKLGDMTEADSSPANYRFTTHALANAPTGGSGSAPTAAQNAAAVWDEALGAHVAAGTFGKLVQLIEAVTDKLGDMLEADSSPANYRFTVHALAQGPAGSAPTAAEVAAQVWASLVEGSYSYEDAVRMLLAVAVGKSFITTLSGDAATVTFRDITDSTNIVVADMSGSERQSLTLSP